MEYDCKIVLAKQLIGGGLSPVKPLCTYCINKGCTNPIVSQKISIRGIIHTSRLYKLGDRFYFVTECDGFVSGEDKNEI